MCNSSFAAQTGLLPDCLLPTRIGLGPDGTRPRCPARSSSPRSRGPRSELWDAVDYLVRTGQAKKAVPYLDKFMKSKPDDATLIAIRNRYGLGSILRLNDDPATQPFAEPLAKTLAAAARTVRDPARADRAVHRPS